MKRCAYRALLRYIHEIEKAKGRTVTDVAIDEYRFWNGDIQLRLYCTLEEPEQKGGAK